MKIEYQESFNLLIEEIIANNPELTELNLHNQGLDDADTIRLAQALAQNEYIMLLDIYQNEIGAEGAQALSQNNQLTSLDISNNLIGDAGAIALANHNTLEDLNISVNNIENEGVAAFANNETITSFSIRGNFVRDEGIQALMQNTNITDLDVSQNIIGNAGIQALRDSQLEFLNIADNGIGDEGITILASNQTITDLTTDQNDIENGGAQALALNNTIRTLDITENNIGDEGAQALALNNTIRTLDITENNIGDEGGKALAQNKTIMHLESQENDISDAVNQLLDKAMNGNRSLSGLVEKLYQQFMGKADATLSENETFLLSEINDADYAIRVLNLLYPQIDPENEIKTLDDVSQRIKPLESGGTNVYVGIDKLFEIASKAPEESINRLPNHVKTLVRTVNLEQTLVSHGVGLHKEIQSSDLGKLNDNVSNHINSYLAPEDIPNNSPHVDSAQSIVENTRERE